MAGTDEPGCSRMIRSCVAIAVAAWGIVIVCVGFCGLLFPEFLYSDSRLRHVPIETYIACMAYVGLGLVFALPSRMLCSRRWCMWCALLVASICSAALAYVVNITAVDRPGGVVQAADLVIVTFVFAAPLVWKIVDVRMALRGRG